VAAVADAFGVGRFAVMGASGGGPHAPACAALLGDRVACAATIAGIAPYTEDVDWFAGMRGPGGLRAAREGRAARARYAETDEFDPESFTAADWAALQGRWRSLGADAMAAGEAGPDGLVDDDLGFASPAHADWMVRRCARPELWLRPRDGHVSVLDACAVAIEWLRAHRADGGAPA
jgi:pimeloyl-ACP methyl ester carboxylesterase